jgi:hypothetical protein
MDPTLANRLRLAQPRASATFDLHLRLSFDCLNKTRFTGILDRPVTRVRRPEKTTQMKIFDLFTGKDDVERAASEEDPEVLKSLLKTRKLLVPRMPQRFLDAAAHTEEQLAELRSAENSEIAELLFEPWILEVNGVKKLPVFSSMENMKAFSAQMFVELNQVFALGHEEMLLADVIQGFKFQIASLNIYSEGSRELAVKEFAPEAPTEEPAQPVSEMDDLELVAAEGNVELLKNYLKSRRVLIPKKPQATLDASNYTGEQFAELIAAESSELAQVLFEPWILNENGLRKLPVFSSLAALERFQAAISAQLNQVFASGYEEMLFGEGTQGFEFDLLCLNLFSRPSWELDLKSGSSPKPSAGGGA